MESLRSAWLYIAAVTKIIFAFIMHRHKSLRNVLSCTACDISDSTMMWVIWQCVWWGIGSTSWYKVRWAGVLGEAQVILDPIVLHSQTHPLLYMGGSGLLTLHRSFQATKLFGSSKVTEHVWRLYYASILSYRNLVSCARVVCSLWLPLHFAVPNCTRNKIPTW